MRRLALALLALPTLAAPALAQTERQPKVQPGPGEPDWAVILEDRYRTEMFGDLANPVRTSADAVPGLFRKAGDGPVAFRPEIALGLEVPIRGGYYLPGPEADAPEIRPLWAYQYKNTAEDVSTGAHLPPPLSEGSKVEFDPGDSPFGLAITNDQFRDTVYTEPARVAAHNPRLAAQPYKAMIYPYRDPKTGEVVPHSYLIGWEYSTNDDFQDVVCRIDNVDLVPADE
jgi:hypothetical protein